MSQPTEQQIADRTQKILDANPGMTPAQAIVLAIQALQAESAVQNPPRRIGAPG